MFREELCKVGSSNSLRMQELAQAFEFDFIVSIPASPGSLAEVHEFAADQRINGKMLTFINQQHVKGYKQSERIHPQVASSVAGLCTTPPRPKLANIMDTTVQEVQKVREIKYLLAGRF